MKKFSDAEKRNKNALSLIKDQRNIIDKKKAVETALKNIVFQNVINLTKNYLYF